MKRTKLIEFDYNNRIAVIKFDNLSDVNVIVKVNDVVVNGENGEFNISDYLFYSNVIVIEYNNGELEKSSIMFYYNAKFNMDGITNLNYTTDASYVVKEDNGNVYICPSAFNQEDFLIGRLEQIDYEKQRRIFDEQIAKSSCGSCSVKYICGGECLIEKHLSNRNNPLMCKYKKHLILLSIYFTFQLIEKNYPMFINIANFARSTLQRYTKDMDLDKYLKEHPEYSFTEGKKVFDQLYSKY